MMIISRKTVLFVGAIFFNAAFTSIVAVETNPSPEMIPAEEADMKTDDQCVYDQTLFDKDPTTCALVYTDKYCTTTGSVKKVDDGWKAKFTSENNLDTFIVRKGCFLKGWLKQGFVGTPSYSVAGPIVQKEGGSIYYSYTCRCPEFCQQNASRVPAFFKSKQVCAVAWDTGACEMNQISRMIPDQADTSFPIRPDETERRPGARVMVRPGCALSLYKGNYFNGTIVKITGPYNQDAEQYTNADGTQAYNFFEVYSYQCHCQSPHSTRLPTVHSSSSSGKRYCAAGIEQVNQEAAAIGEFYDGQEITKADVAEFKNLTSFLVAPGCTLSGFTNASYSGDNITIYGPLSRSITKGPVLKSYKCSCGCPMPESAPSKFVSGTAKLCARGWPLYSTKTSESCGGLPIEITAGTNISQANLDLKTFVVEPGCSLYLYPAQGYRGNSQKILGPAANVPRAFEDVRSLQCSCHQECPHPDQTPMIYNEDKFICTRLFQSDKCQGHFFDIPDGDIEYDTYERTGQVYWLSFLVRSGCTFQYWDRTTLAGTMKEFVGPNTVTAVSINLRSHKCFCDARPITCHPTDDFEVILQCDATNSVVDTECSYVKTIGTTLSEEHSKTESYAKSSNNLTIDVTETLDAKAESSTHSVGVTVEASVDFWGLGGASISGSYNYEKQNSKSTSTMKRFETQKSVSETTGYDWTTSSSQSTTESQSFSVIAIAPAGKMLKIEQVVGRCGGSVIKTEMFRITHYDASGNVSRSQIEHDSSMLNDQNSSPKAKQWIDPRISVGPLMQKSKP